MAERDIPLNSEAIQLEKAISLLCEAEAIIDRLKTVAERGRMGAKRTGYVTFSYEMPEAPGGTFTDKVNADDLEEVADEINHAMMACSRFTPTGT